MEENNRFDFCPKCGALAKDGVCQSCGYRNPEYAGFVAEPAQSVPAQPEAPAQTTQEQPETLVQSAPAQPEASVQTAPAQQDAPAQTAPAQQETSVQSVPAQQETSVQTAPARPETPAQTASVQQAQGYYTQPQPGQGYYGQNGYMQNQYDPSQYSQNQYAQGQYNQNLYGQNPSQYGAQPGNQYGGQPGAQPGNQYGSQSGDQGYYGQQNYYGQYPYQGYYGQQAQAGQGYYGTQGTQQGGQYAAQQVSQQGGQYGSQQGGMSGSGYIPSAVPPAAADKKSGKSTAVLLIVLGVVLLAVLILILVGLYRLFDKDKKEDRWEQEQEEEWEDSVEEEPAEDWLEEEQEAHGWDENPQEDGAAYDYTYVHDSYDSTQENWEEPGQDESMLYYSGPYNALRDDLSYQVNFVCEFYCSEESSAVNIMADYPQLSGDIPGIDEINRHLREEYVFYQETFEEDFKPLLQSTDDYYICNEDCYVTYMDENILSMVRKESVYMNLDGDTLALLYFNCFNLDVKTGELIENTEVLNVDEAFVATLREREKLENESLVLDRYTDEEIMEMLNDRDTLVLFYTPMGMEVGLNLDQRVIYFMYQDYDQYLKAGAL